MLNALIYRPGEGRAETELLAAACQHLGANGDSGGSDNEDQTEPVLYKQGLYFLSDIINDPHCYRLPDTRSVNDQVLAVLYRRSGMTEIKQSFDLLRLTGSSTVAHKTRIHNKRGKTLDIRFAQPDEGIDTAEAVLLPSFNLEVQGVTIRPQLRMSGPDLRAEPSDSEGDDEEGNIDAQVTRIWRQFAFDIFQVSPNRKAHTSESWILLGPAALAKVTPDIFKSLDLTTL